MVMSPKLDGSFSTALLSLVPSELVSAVLLASLGKASELSPTPSLSVSLVSEASLGKASNVSRTRSPSESPKIDDPKVRSLMERPLMKAAGTPGSGALT